MILELDRRTEDTPNFDGMTLFECANEMEEMLEYNLSLSFDVDQVFGYIKAKLEMQTMRLNEDCKLETLSRANPVNRMRRMGM